MDPLISPKRTEQGVNFGVSFRQVYPWDYSMGEAAWIRAALEHVCEGYSVNLTQYVGGDGGNPYKRFIKEQYRARRCALFHAKLSEAPIIPDDIATRAELLGAMRQLGQLHWLSELQGQLLAAAP